MEHILGKGANMAKTTKEELTTQTNTSPEPKQNRSLEAVTGSVDTKVKAATDNKDKGTVTEFSVAETVLSG